MIPAANLLTVASIYGDGSWLISLLTNPLFIFIVTLDVAFVSFIFFYRHLRRFSEWEKERKE